MSFKTAQCDKCGATTERDSLGVVPAGWCDDPSFCPKCDQALSGLSQMVANKAVVAMIERLTKQKLNEVVRDLRDTTFQRLLPDERKELATATLQIIGECAEEFVREMLERVEQDYKASPSVAARGRKASLPGPAFAPAEGPERK